MSTLRGKLYTLFFVKVGKVTLIFRHSMKIGSSHLKRKDLSNSVIDCDHRAYWGLSKYSLIINAIWTQLLTV